MMLEDTKPLLKSPLAAQSTFLWSVETEVNFGSLHNGAKASHLLQKSHRLTPLSEELFLFYWIHWWLIRYTLVHYSMYFVELTYVVWIVSASCKENMVKQHRKCIQRGWKSAINMCVCINKTGSSPLIAAFWHLWHQVPEQIWTLKFSLTYAVSSEVGVNGEER